MINYKEKYLKYKEKYLKLLELSGGVDPIKKLHKDIYTIFIKNKSISLDVSQHYYYDITYRYSLFIPYKYVNVKYCGYTKDNFEKVEFLTFVEYKDKDKKEKVIHYFYPTHITDITKK